MGHVFTTRFQRDLHFNIILHSTSISSKWSVHFIFSDQFVILEVSKAVSLHHTCGKRERMYSSYSFLTSALDGGEWSASRPGSVFPRERAVGTHCTGGWVGLRAGLDTEDRGKSFASSGDRTPVGRLPAPSYLSRVNVYLPEIRTCFQPDLLLPTLLVCLLDWLKAQRCTQGKKQK
jgi:hypothetical protein